MVLTKVKISFFLYCITLVFFFQSVRALARDQSHAGQAFRFIENKGQWDESVLFKADLGNGVIFVEKDGFTFDLLSEESIKARHNHDRSGGVSVGKPREPQESIKGHVYRTRFKGANPDVETRGVNPLPEYFNYMLGDEPSRWTYNVKAYTRVYFKDLYEGIDLVLYTNGSNLKYDFFVRPGADPDQIRFAYEGVDLIKSRNRQIELFTNAGKIVESRPIAFEQFGSDTVTIECAYRETEHGYGFEFPKGFNRDKTLIIDPELVFSTYSGSVADNFGFTTTYDHDGFLYSGSIVFSSGYPTTLGAYNRYFQGGTDVAITKYDTTGTFMIWSTLIGGNGYEAPHSMICNAQNELYVFGTTGSFNFPTTPDAYDRTFNNQATFDVKRVRVMPGLGIQYPYGCDMFVLKLGKDGDELKSSTYVGGSGNDGLNSTRYDSVYFVGLDAYVRYGPWAHDTLRYNYADEMRGEIDIDENNNIYIATCTSSDDFPIVGNTWQRAYGGGRLDGVIVKMDAQLRNILWSTYLGGSGPDAIYSLALDKAGGIYVTGGTRSDDFPIEGPVAQPDFGGGRSDAFISYLDASGQTLIRSTYWGSEEYDQAYFVEMDHQNYVYILGQTEGKGDRFVHNVAYAQPNSGQFITKFSPLLDTLMWSTAFGTGSGAPDISPTAFLVDVCRKIYLSGWGGGANQNTFLNNQAGFTTGLPVTSDAFQASTDGSDFYLMVMEDDASALHYATFMGGSLSNEHVDGGTSRFDRKGKIYQSVCAGCRGNSDFPIKPANAYSPTNKSLNCNNAVFKFNFEMPAVIADFDVPDIGCAPYELEITNRSQERDNTKYFWDFGDGTTSTDKIPTHIYTKAGIYKIKLRLEDIATCNLSDSTEREIVILSDTSYTLPPENICPGDFVQIGIMPKNIDTITYQWNPMVWLSDPHVSNPIATPESSMEYTLLVSNGVCTDTIVQEVVINPVEVNMNDLKVCSSENPLTLSPVFTGSPDRFLWAREPDFADIVNPSELAPSLLVDQREKAVRYYVKAINQYGCFDTTSFEVIVSDLYIELSADSVTFCEETELYIGTSLDHDDLSYQWSPVRDISGRSDTSRIVIRPVAPGYIHVTAINELGCVYTDSVFARVYKDTSYALPDLPICPGASVELGLFPSDKSNTYRWSPATWLDDTSAANPTAVPEGSIQYTLFMSNGVCTDTITQRVMSRPVEIEIDGDIMGCSYEGPFSLDVQFHSGNPVIYHWSNYPDFSDRLNTDPANSQIWARPIGNENYYYVKAENSTGCVDIDSVRVLLTDLFIETSGPAYICSGADTRLYAESSLPGDQVSYQWRPEMYIEGPSNTSSIVVRPERTRYFYVSGVNSYGCVYHDSVLVELSPLTAGLIEAWTDKDTLYEGTSTNIHVRPVFPYHYHWTPEYSLSDPGSTDPVATPPRSTEYWVTVTDQRAGCRVDTNLYIEVIPVICEEPNIFVPNAFSPNGDGHNDVLHVRGSFIEEMVFVIYDRWGEKVFESSRPREGWDGTYKGRKVDPAVFVYYLEVKCIGGKSFFKKGNVTVLK